MYNTRTPVGVQFIEVLLCRYCYFDVGLIGLPGGRGGWGKERRWIICPYVQSSQENLYSILDTFIEWLLWTRNGEGWGKTHRGEWDTITNFLEIYSQRRKWNCHPFASVNLNTQLQCSASEAERTFERWGFQHHPGGCWQLCLLVSNPVNPSHQWIDVTAGSVPQGGPQTLGKGLPFTQFWKMRIKRCFADLSALQ